MDNKKQKWYQLDSRTISNLMIVCIGILLYLALTHLPQVRRAIDGFLDVMAPFIGGFVLAYLLNEPTNFFQKKVYKNSRHSRILAIVTVYLITLAVILLLLQLVLPQVADSIFSLVSNLSIYLGNLTRMAQELIQYFHLEGNELSALVADYQTLMKNAANFITSSAPELFNFGMSVGSGLVNAVTALIASIYMLAGKNQLIRQMKKLIFALFPARGSRKILSVADRANRIFIGFINGKLVDSAIIGVLCFALTSIFRIPYAVLMSVVVGVTNVIPFFGPIIGAVPCLMILIIVNPWAALRFGILIIALQQFDGNILGPKILGDSTGLSAIWVLVAIVVGGGLFGFLGMLLGVPTFAVLYSLMREWADKRLEEKGIDANGEPIAVGTGFKREE